MKAKAGEIIELSAPSLHLGTTFVVVEKPDISNYDLKDDKKNPFFPRTPGEIEQGSPIFELQARARDSRVRVFVVKRDCELWVAGNGAGPGGSTYALTVKPATRSFGEGQQNSGALRIGYTDYWQFEAKAGDVMKLRSTVSGFAPQVAVFDPDFGEVWRAVAVPDQDTFDWDMIVRKPGRYIVAVSALGDGAAGSYTLGREVFAARDFSKDSPAMGSFSAGDVEVWKFKASPGAPMLLRWTSSSWPFTVSVTDENGNGLGLPMTLVDGNHQFGILNVDRERTFVIVLINRGTEKPNYSLEILDLPGLEKRGN
jgi:hypothetical protein